MKAVLGIAACVTALLFGLSLAACDGSNEFVSGAAGIGDPYYDTLGNRGHDAAAA